LTEKEYVPDRGHLIWLNLNPKAGHEQAGHRPAIVLSPISYNSKSGLAVVCPITNQQKGYPFEVPIPGGLAIMGVVLSDHIRCLDWRTRNAAYSCNAPKDVLDDVIAKVNALIGT